MVRRPRASVRAEHSEWCVRCVWRNSLGYKLLRAVTDLVADGGRPGPHSGTLVASDCRDRNTRERKAVNGIGTEGRQEQVEGDVQGRGVRSGGPHCGLLLAPLPADSSSRSAHSREGVQEARAHLRGRGMRAAADSEGLLLPPLSAGAALRAPDARAGAHLRAADLPGAGMYGAPFVKGLLQEALHDGVLSAALG